MNKHLLALIVLVSSSANALQLDKASYFAPSKLGDIQVHYKDGRFFVQKEDEFTPVKNHNVEKPLRHITQERLEALLWTAKLTVDEIEQIHALVQESDLFTQEEKDEALNSPIQVMRPAYLSIGQDNGGDYTIRIKQRMLGAGGFGAWLGAIGGKFIVHAVVGGACGAIGLAATPFVGPVAGYALASGTWGLVAPTTEALSTAAALAGGIAGGVATGPV